MATILGSMAAAVRMRVRRQHAGHGRTTCAAQDRRSRATQLRAHEDRHACESSSSDSACRVTSAGASPAPTTSASVDPVEPGGRLPRHSRTCRWTATTRRWRAFPTSRRSSCSATAWATASTCWSKSRSAAASDDDLTELEALARAQGRRLLHRLQSPLRAAFRAHARPDRRRRAGQDLSLPHVLRQRHGAAGARIRPGATRAPACCPISARICSIPARFWFGDIGDEFRDRRRPTASRTARPIMWSSRRETADAAAGTGDDAADRGATISPATSSPRTAAAHIQSLCKWGPSDVHHAHARAAERAARRRSASTLVQDDPTWALEYAHFKALCAARHADRSGQ